MHTDKHYTWWLASAGYYGNGRYTSCWLFLFLGKATYAHRTDGISYAYK